MTAVKWLSAAVLAYAALTLLVFVSQRKLLYHPDSFRPSRQQAAAAGMAHWPDDGAAYRGLIGVTTRQQADGTVVVFHGNAGSAAQRGYLLDALTRQNLRVILAEYPGYGGRSGAPGEALFVADALQTLRSAYDQFGGPLYVWGESLGAGVAAAAAAKTPLPLAAVVMFTPWDSLPNVAQTHYWYLPARWLVRDRFDSVANLQNFSGKVAVVLAEQDQVIPIRHGRALYRSLAVDKRLWLFPGAGHNRWPADPQFIWWRELVEYIRS